MKLTHSERRKLAQRRRRPTFTITSKDDDEAPRPPDQRSWTIPEFTWEAAFYGSILFVLGVVATLVGFKLSFPGVK